MKVLSIKEPYATLIATGDKLIETRSWKTNYRGELYIHASSAKIVKKHLTNQYVIDISKNLKMNYGNIICKSKLVDCIYMDQDFIDSIKKDQKEYHLGQYELGRYAWVLADVELIKPIPAKGKLNIWNYNDK